MNGSYFLLTNLLSEDEKRVITGIAARTSSAARSVRHPADRERISLRRVDREMCKRLGFDGYSELYYYLSRQMDRRGERSAENLKTLVDNYSDELVNGFCAALDASLAQGKMFTITLRAFPASWASISRSGSPSAALWSIITSISMTTCSSASAHDLTDEEAAPSVMFAVSQSGETEPVLNDVRHARQNGHKIVTFTKRADSALARLADLVIVVDGSKQTLAGSLPNPFFGHVILAFEGSWPTISGGTQRTNIFTESEIFSLSGCAILALRNGAPCFLRMRRKK